MKSEPLRIASRLAPTSPVPSTAISDHARGGSYSPKITLPLGTLGHPVELSVPWEVLNSDAFVSSAPKMDVAGMDVPSLAGIPLLCKLGQGGMGAVYYGVHPGFAHEVAVKVLPFHLAQTQPELVDRFFREARLAAQINCDHLVRVSDVGRQGSLCYLVMEYVSGKSAAKILSIGCQGGALGLDEAMTLDICIAACEGLAAAHDANVIHRDIKPDNILIPLVKGTREYDFHAAKLADLGLGRCEGLHSTVTGSEICLGSPGYMSPEQIDDTRHVGKQADIFSFGATLYTLLCGDHPFSAATQMSTLEATKYTDHVPAKLLRIDVSEATNDLIQNCLSKNPRDRFADGTALLRALRSCRDSLRRRRSSTSPASTQRNTIKVSSSRRGPMQNVARSLAKDLNREDWRQKLMHWKAGWVAAGIIGTALLASGIYAIAMH